ncbi:MAG: UDP-3-O-(3-hydroxymyristoyl)glucosamine N-acyltransferase [Xanthomonadales bacterium]|nr:UDP-3-O-(3-hydroxymyristoyl)glucosamine N-acyltransferase [Xanthomonadales bacterium]ODU94839.1 MAG: UDP-3-O-(3-hydroxymyristoyl)glucosamine N-acyltransferase [Rhodanobacter sp. SCN 66-43]OJY82826.1 MAG: UDP-3-O-(3-hydroxymyristoyl)glucosamine N-acyltransferase [Xanthomonadales bacterium 66-474]
MERSTGYRIDELARRFGLEARGDATRVIRGVAPLRRAQGDQLAFLAHPRYAVDLAHTQAGVVVLRAEHADASPVPALVTKDPYLAYARLAALFENVPPPAPGVHPTAIVAADAKVDPSASVGPCCVIEPGATVAAGATLGPHCVIGADCTVGAQSRLGARVTLVVRVALGKRVLIHAGAVLGADGFGLARDRDGWVKVPQLGGVRVGDDCEIGANTTIDRGALEDTVLEEDVRLDNQIQIAHNVRIGAHSALAGCAAVAGSATIGRDCLIGGGAGVLGHLDIADGVTITAMTLVTHSIRKAGVYSSGAPVEENRAWRRNAARMRQLDGMARRIAALEKQLQALIKERS